MFRQKPKRLTIKERLELLERLEAGESATSLASSYGITKSAITWIKKNKETLLERKRSLDESGGDPAKKKKWTGVEDSELEKSLYRWFLQKRLIGEPVSGPLLQEKARIFNNLLNGPASFVASDGFLSNFKKRHGIGCLSVQGEKLSGDSEAAESSAHEIRQHLQENGYTMDRVYNADETGLYWRLLPDKTLAARYEKNSSESKEFEDRVTLMVCANASGTHKIPITVIGKSANPKCLKNVKSLETVYKGQRSAWMDRTLMQEWYRGVFLPEIRRFHGGEGNKCILLLDNAPGHSPAEKINETSELCEVKFLPASVASTIQPMDRGVIEKLKEIYRKNLLRLALTEDTSSGVRMLLKSLTMLDCCNFVGGAWKGISERRIRSAWKILYPSKIQDTSADDSPRENTFLDIARKLPNQSELRESDVNLWLNFDRRDPGWRITSDEEIVDGMVHAEIEDPCEEDFDSDSKENVGSDLTPKDAFYSLQIALQWYQKQDECRAEYVEVLNNLKSLATTYIIMEKKIKENSL